MVKRNSVTRRSSKRRVSKSVRKSQKRRTSKSVRKSPKRHGSKKSKRTKSRSKKSKLRGGAGFAINPKHSIGGLARVDRYTNCKSSGSNKFDNL
jgi:hypothetical protein